MTSDTRQRAADVLCSTELDDMVEMVISSPAPGLYEARAVDGRVQFRRAAARVAPDPTGWEYEVVVTEGRDPLAQQDPTRFAPLDEELARRQPDRSANSYPEAFDRIAQVFDHPCAPDLCVLHTAGHRYSTNRGEHGSLDVVQSRAPFIASGPGIAARGLVDGHCRLIDVAPTVLALLGVAPGPGIGPTGEPIDDALVARQDGSVLTSVIDPGAARPEHVVCFLLDGANANRLYHAAATGLAPNIGRLVEEGTALRHGALASLPTVTLANHTTLLTGAHPGHHGVLHNAWYDRQLGRQVVTESPATWQEAMQWLFDGVETVHEALHRRRPDAVSVSVNEPADRGADYSTFELLRQGEGGKLMAAMEHPVPRATQRFVEGNEHYKWASTVDASAVNQAVGLWSGEWLDRRYGLPAFCWVNLSLTDAAFHEGGPHSEMADAAIAETDARVGDILAAVEARGVRDRTTVLVMADHGMEETSPEMGGDWGPVLRRAGIEHRDEASGFLYLGVPADGDPHATAR